MPTYAASTRPAPSTGTRIMSWIWAVTPLWTLGFGTAPIMIFAAFRVRHWLQIATAVVYTAALVLAFAVDRDFGGVQRMLFDATIAINLVGGAAHALGIRSRVFGLHRTALTAAERQRRALQDYEEQRRVREAARTIAAEDPMRAVGLAIGRIDLPGREFPDGGLIDVNNVAPHRIASEVKALEPYTERLAEHRAQVRGFDSVEDMSVALDLPPHLLDPHAERLIFLPRYEA